jgi:UDP-glucose 4-epimerase
MKAFVTGGTGFIGSHLVDRLVKEGHEVTCLVKKNRKDLKKLGTEAVEVSYLKKLGVEIVYGDLRSKKSLIKIANRIKSVDVVFHLAALARAYEYLGVKDYFLTNVEGTRNLLEAFKKKRIEKFIYVSSIEAVGKSKTGEPLTEESPCNPVGIYGRTKRLAELLTLEYYKKYGMPTCILRFPMTYGPRSTLLWPRLFNLVRKGFYPIIGSGETKFEFCFVGNEVEGMMKAAEAENINGEIFFISDERSYKIKEVLEAIAKEMNVDLKIIHLPYTLAYLLAINIEGLSKIFKFYPFAVPETGRPAFSRRTIDWTTKDSWICDISKAKRMLKYKPPFSLREGLRITIDWFREIGLMGD